MDREGAVPHTFEWFTHSVSYSFIHSSIYIVSLWVSWEADRRFIREVLAINAWGREGVKKTWSCDAVSAEQPSAHLGGILKTG